MSVLVDVECLSEPQLHEAHRLLQESWWSRGRTCDEVRRAVEGSTHVFAIVEEHSARLVGFARVLSDGSCKALVLDVVVAPEWRGRGLGTRLMDRVLGHPELASVRHVELYCLPEMLDFYGRWNFVVQGDPIRFLRRRADA